VIVTGQRQRSKEQNTRDALNALAGNKRFKTWLRIKASRMILDQKPIEELVEEALGEENLKIEYYEPK
jgi:hypothetical protein